MTKSLELVRVLVVDDKGFQRDTMIALLMHIGIKYCLAASSALEALRMLESSEHNFHVVLTDKEMPETNGLELVLHIRNNVNLDHVRIAMISGNLSRKKELSETEIKFRELLAILNVLPVPKEGLKINVLRAVLEELTGP